MSIAVECVLTHPDARVPQKAYPGDAGADLHGVEEMVIPPGKSVNIPTGVSVALPPYSWGLITARSSTWSLMGLMVIPGVIDEGYRGELFVVVYNPGSKPKTVLKMQRLAQLIVLPRYRADFAQVSKLPPADRGGSGFGSTGE